MGAVMKRKAVCYLLNFPRPVGLEPTIYLSKPKLDPNGQDENPWHPDVEECYSFTEALSRILHFNLSLALKEFSIKK